MFLGVYVCIYIYIHIYYIHKQNVNFTIYQKQDFKISDDKCICKTI